MRKQGWPFLVHENDIIKSAGGVVYQPSSYEILLVHRPRHNDWSLPKGRLQPGETAVIAAHREVFEETGFGCELQEELSTVRYLNRENQPKEIRFWKMVPRTENGFLPNEEVDEIRWYSYQDALHRMTYKTDRALLQTAFA